jgi:hypothetical protein
MRAGLALLLCGGIALAHPDPYPKRDRLELRPGEVRVVLEYGFPAGDEAQALREQFDRDRSGALEPVERDAIAAYLEAQARRYLRVDGDGRTLSLSRVAGELDLGAGPKGRLAVRVTLAAATHIARTVQLSDRHKDPRQSVPVEVVAVGIRLDGTLPPRPVVFDGQPLTIEIK